MPCEMNLRVSNGWRVISSLVELSNGINPVLVIWTGYLLLKTSRTLNEHDKRISRLEWENDADCER